ncbi:MAG: hypothetical protein FJ138_03740, partial [Deltaproteobacteria bacterium]|nr:hypothetical protein [Deltaproteobacteria bacterium]
MRLRGHPASTLSLPSLASALAAAALLATACGDPPGRQVTRDSPEPLLDEGAPPLDAAPPDAYSHDAALPDADAPDADAPDADAPDAEAPDADAPDADAPDAALPDPDADLRAWRDGCPLAPTPLQERPTPRHEQEAAARLDAGGPPGAGRALPLPGATAEELSWLSIRRGAVERVGAGGETAWSAPAPGVQALRGPWDLDGDGALEVLALSATRALVLSSSSGRLLWSSPDPLLPGGAPLSGLGVARALPLPAAAGGGLGLMLSDSGCGAAGSGDAALFRFSPGGWGAPRVTPLPARDRYAGRCASWGLVEEGGALVLNDGLGPQRFDLNTGARLACGAVPGMAAAGAASLLEAPQGLLLFLADELVLAREGAPASDAACPPGAPALLPAWRLPLPGLVARGVTLLDLDGDGRPVALVTARAPAPEGDRWRVVAVDLAAGEVVAHALDVALLGLAAPPASPEGEAVLLVDERAPGAAPALAAARAVALSLPAARDALRARAAGASSLPAALPLRPLWAQAVAGATPLYAEAPPRATSDLVTLGALDGGALGPLVPLRRRLEGGEEEWFTLSLGGAQGGVVGWRGGDSPWGLAALTCAARPCAAPDRLALADARGDLRLFDPSLEPASPALRRPSGAVALAWGGGRLVTLSKSGVLASHDPAALGAGAPPRWSRRVGAPAFRPPRVPPAPFFDQGGGGVWALRDHLDPAALAWVGARAEDGAEVWRHALPSARWLSVSDARAPALGLVLRHERLEEPEGLADLAPCAAERLYGEVGGAPVTPETLFTPLAACPARPPRPQVLHALHAATGACAWRVVLRPYDDCYGPSLQSVSVADVDGDGAEEALLTETRALRRFDAATGALLSTQELPLGPASARRGGGAALAAPGGAARVGGNGPPEVLRVALSAPPSSPAPDPLLWRAPQLSGLQDQSWLGRPASADAGGLWVSAGATQPLLRFDAAGALRAAVRLGRDAAGALRAAPLDPLDPLAAAPALAPDAGALPHQPLDLWRDPEGRLLVSSAEGALFGLAPDDGALEWARDMGAPLSALLWLDWDGDGALEWASATEEGAVQLYDARDLAAPLALWEAPCAAPALCADDPAEGEDLDALARPDALCYGWRPLAGVDGAEVRLTSDGGEPLSGWLDAPLSGRGVIEGLALLPGPLYRLELRAWVAGDGGERLYTSSVRSDGAALVDRQPPRVALSSSAGALAPGERLTLRVVAEDDVGLAGWALRVYDESGALARALDAAPAEGLTLDAARAWGGEGDGGAPLPPGRYRAAAAVTDAAGL